MRKIIGHKQNPGIIFNSSDNNFFEWLKGAYDK